MKRHPVVLTVMMITVAAGCSSNTTNGPSPFAIQLTPEKLPADGTSSAAITIPDDAVPPLTVRTTFGVLTSSSGSSGSIVELASGDTVTVTSPCDAGAGGICVGHARVSVQDAEGRLGAAMAVFYCPPGVTCAANPTDWTPGGGAGGGGSAANCYARFFTECSGSESGSHFVGVSGTVALDGIEVFSTTGVSGLVAEEGKRVAASTADASPNAVLLFQGSEILTTTSYDIADASSLPSLRFETLAGTCQAASGDFGIDLFSFAGSTIEEFRAIFEIECEGGGKICGCVHVVE